MKAVESECISALWRILKSSDDQELIQTIGRVAKEVCLEAHQDYVHRKLLQDGVMNMLLRLSKIEVPELKHDVSCALYALTTGNDTTKVIITTTG